MRRVSVPLIACAALTACAFVHGAPPRPRPEGPFDVFRHQRHLAGDYLSPIEALLDSADSASFMYRTRLAWEWSTLGAYDRVEDATPSPPYLVESSEAALMEAIRPLPAVPALCAAAHGRRLVMIDEEHPFPLDRAFGAAVLPCLRADGFDALAVEMLDDDVTPVRADGVPRGYHGNFTDEPRMADLLSEAIALGFELVPYEHVPPSSVTGMKRRIEQREQGEADRLSAFLRDHPKSRVVVWCGYDHLYERAIDGTPWMAARVRADTGIDPLTVVQRAGRIREDDAGPLFVAVNRHREQAGPLLVDLGAGWDRMPASFRAELAADDGGPLADLLVIHESRRRGDPRHAWLERPAEEAHPVEVACDARRHPLGVIVQLFRDRAASGRDTPYDQALCPCDGACELVAPPGRWFVVVRDEWAPSLATFVTLGPEPVVLHAGR